MIPTISIITCTYNADLATFRLCLEAIKKQAYPKRSIEHLVMDAGSTNGTIALAKEYGCRVIVRKDLREREEIRQSIGFQKAKHQILLVLESDNILVGDDWLRKMTLPFVKDKTIVGTYSAYNGYEKHMSALTRYTAFFGSPHPILFYLGKSDKIPMTQKKYDKGTIIAETNDYYTVEFTQENLPTCGDNGHMIRRSAMNRVNINPETYVHLDAMLGIVKNGLNRFGVVKNSIIHMGKTSLLDDVKRKIQLKREYYDDKLSLRTYLVFDWKSGKDRMNIFKYIVYSLTWIEPLYRSIQGYRKIPDSAWFIHPIFCFLMFWGHIYSEGRRIAVATASRAYHWNAFIVSFLLFIIPFFWTKPGYVEMGSDNGRLYFIEPLWVIQSILNVVDSTKLYWLVSIPHIFFIFLVKLVVGSSHTLMSIEHGIQLSLAFLFAYFSIFELMRNYQKEHDGAMARWASFVAGFVYIGFITVFGWPLSFFAHNQVFLNPLLFFLMLRYLLTGTYWYALIILATTIVYSANFGFGTTPQIFSFFPLSALFLFFYVRILLGKIIHWKKLFVFSLALFGLHAYHIVPLVASFMEKNGMMATTYIGSQGVMYFDVNRYELGKISLQLFQPTTWYGKTVFIFLVPCLTLLGFIQKPSKLLILLGIFFSATLLLVSANITNIGVQFYRFLFSIPGFLMFRSFNEKWYFVYVFFFSLLFAVSFYSMIRDRKGLAAHITGWIIIASILFRIYPFFRGDAVNTTYWQSNKVTGSFIIDSDLLDGIRFIKTMSDDGKILTLPLTSAFQQLAYGKEGGAYAGISWIQNLGGRKDFPGFLSFGVFQEGVFEALRTEDLHALLQQLSFLNIQYVFRNHDPRIMDNFPGFPYIAAGSIPTSKEQLSLIKNQDAYDQLVSHLPLTQLFSKGFYTISELDRRIVRPRIYIPDRIYSSQSAALQSLSFRSAFGDREVCNRLERFNLVCEGITYDTEPIPEVSFSKKSQTSYDISLVLRGRTRPFIIILSEEYRPSWKLVIDGVRIAPEHMVMNGYANAWVIDPKKIGIGESIKGSIILEFQEYYTYGAIVSIITAVGIVTWVIVRITKRIYEKKRG